MTEGSRTAGATPPPASETPPERTTVRRRYRRALGGWWWLALVLVPLVLAGLTVGLDHSSGAASAEPSGSPTPTETSSSSASPSSTSASSAPSSTTPSSSTTSTAGVAVEKKPFSITRTDGDITVTGTAASVAAKKELLDTVRENAADGTNVVDKVAVNSEVAGLPDNSSLGALLAHLKDTKDFGLTLDGTKATVNGTVDSSATATSVMEATKKAFPAAQAVDKLTVEAKGSPTKRCDVTALSRTADAATAWFAHGSTAILPASQAGLNRLAEATTACTKGEITLTLTGYTDNTGTDAINGPLSKQRAAAVRQYLVTHGVTVSIASEYRGAQNPIASNQSADGRAKNRRVVVTVK